MARQLTVRIPEDIDQGITAACRKLSLTPSEIVRQALRQYLLLVGGQETPARRVASLLGSLESGTPDLADRHREYVLESLQRGR